MAAENRIRKKHGIRPLDADWRWVQDYDVDPLIKKDDGTYGSHYEKRGPYGRETKDVSRDRRPGELVSDMDVYPSGRTFVLEWEDGRPTTDEFIAATFHYRTGKFGETVDGSWYPSVDYEGDQKRLENVVRGKENFTAREVDRLVSEMRDPRRRAP